MKYVGHHGGVASAWRRPVGARRRTRTPTSDGNPLVLTPAPVAFGPQAGQPSGKGACDDLRPHRVRRRAGSHWRPGPLPRACRTTPDATRHCQPDPRMDTVRLLIANDLDDWILRKSDVRAWTHRLLWLA